jgi:hypothetical protein
MMGSGRHTKGDHQYAGEDKLQAEVQEDQLLLLAPCFSPTTASLHRDV